jgi:hypothetical protein
MAEVRDRGRVAVRHGVVPHGCHRQGRVVTPRAGRVLRRFKGLALKNPNMGGGRWGLRATEVVGLALEIWTPPCRGV